MKLLSGCLTGDQKNVTLRTTTCRERWDYLRWSRIFFKDWSGSSSILGEKDCSESPQSDGDRGNGMASVWGGGQLRGSSISLWHRPVPRLMIHALRSPGRCCRHVYIYTTGKAMCGLSRTPGRCRNDGKLGSGVSTSSLAAVYEEVWGRLLSWSSVSPC